MIMEYMESKMQDRLEASMSEYEQMEEEIQTLRAKVASVEVLRKALDMFVKDCTGEIIHSTNWMSQQGKKALATYDKLSEVKHDTNK